MHIPSLCLYKNKMQTVFRPSSLLSISLSLTHLSIHGLWYAYIQSYYFEYFVSIPQHTLCIQKTSHLQERHFVNKVACVLKKERQLLLCHPSQMHMFKTTAFERQNHHLQNCTIIQPFQFVLLYSPLLDFNPVPRSKSFSTDFTRVSGMKSIIKEKET